MSDDSHIDKSDLANLATKLSEIYDEVRAVEKTGENDYHGYTYVEEAQIVAKIRKALAERDIMLTSSTVDMKKSGKDGSLTTVEMQYTFIDGETGAKITKHWYGEGKDDQDKGAYKAYTGATKYFLLKTFLVPTGDDPESFEDIYDEEDPTPDIGEQRHRIFGYLDAVGLEKDEVNARLSDERQGYVTADWIVMKEVD